jgi:LysM repeat protein
MSPAPLRVHAACRRLATGGGVGLALAAATVATAVPAAADEDHVVAAGETVSHLALRYGTSTAAIVQANALDRRASIRIGQRLTIPTGSGPTTTAAPAPAPTPAPAATYKVASGDTVSRLATRFGTTVAAVVQANGLDARAFIRVGQVLTIPTGTAATPAASPAAPAAAAAPAATYTVASGDTVSALATRFGTTVAAIVQANGLDQRARIRIGQQLAIPGAPAGTVAGPALVGSTFAGRTYPAATVASANQNKATLLAVGVPSKADMQALVARVAREMGVDPALAQAVAFQESGFTHTSVSPANAIGTMQVIPSSGQWASELVGRELNLLDPTDNVVAGVAILRQLVRSADDLPSAIAGYYQGLSSVRRNGMYDDTRRYVASVRTLMSRFA